LIQFPAMLSGASFAGTCLMQTTMFTGTFPFDRGGRMRSGCGPSSKGGVSEAAARTHPGYVEMYTAI
jgi:hypothetical protein